MIYILGIFSFFISSFALAGERACTTVVKSSITQFHCYDTKTGQSFFREVDTLAAQSIITSMEKSGVAMLGYGEFLALSSRGMIEGIITGPNELVVKECLHNVFYRENEFNALSIDHATIDRLKELTRALHEAGVCEIPVVEQEFNNINIKNSDDVLRHFLCISNSESVFGRDNIGQGGRGPWGIHPMHNLPNGSRVNVGGSVIQLKEDGLCYPSQAVVRNSNNDEVKVNERYHNYEVRLDNAKCAIKLYSFNHPSHGVMGFRDWGRNGSWGSNRHCSQGNRENLDFSKYLGELSCCSQTCKDEIKSNNSTSL